MTHLRSNSPAKTGMGHQGKCAIEKSHALEGSKFTDESDK